MTYKNIKGITLTEILIALLILATAFIPIIGVMSGSIKGTQKDETVLKAVQLSQQALSTALQIPFNDLVANKGAGGGPWTFGTADSTFDYATGSLNLRLGKVTVGNIDHTLTLTIDDVPFVFTLDTHDPMARNTAPADPSSWGWQETSVPRTDTQAGLYHRYTLTNTWTEKGLTDGNQRIYRLISYKARLHEL